MSHTLQLKYITKDPLCLGALDSFLAAWATQAAEPVYTANPFLFSHSVNLPGRQAHRVRWLNIIHQTYISRYQGLPQYERTRCCVPPGLKFQNWHTAWCEQSKVCPWCFLRRQIACAKLVTAKAQFVKVPTVSVQLVGGRAYGSDMIFSLRDLDVKLKHLHNFLQGQPRFVFKGFRLTKLNVNVPAATVFAWAEPEQLQPFVEGLRGMLDVAETPEDTPALVRRTCKYPIPVLQDVILDNHGLLSEMVLHSRRLRDVNLLSPRRQGATPEPCSIPKDNNERPVRRFSGLPREAPCMGIPSGHRW